MAKSFVGALAVILLASRAVLADDATTLPQRVKAATDKAAAALAAGWDPKVNPKPRLTAADPSGRERPLVALALLRAGGAKEREVARRLVDSWWADAEANKINTGSLTYELALEISALEGLGLERIVEATPTTQTRYEALPLPAETQRRIEVATAALLSLHTVTGDDDKGWAWGYGVGPLPLGAGATRERRFPTIGRTGNDNSNTQFAVLALHDAARAGVKIAPETASAIAEHFLSSAIELLPPEAMVPAGRRAPAPAPSPKGTTMVLKRAIGWDYSSGRGVPSLSMTCAGLSSLAISRDLGATNAHLDDAIKRALAGLPGRTKGLVQQGYADGFSLLGWSQGYDLYSLEKALDLLDVKDLDGLDWYGPIAERLLASQKPNGLWEEGSWGDALYVLFLVRATVSRSRVVDKRATGGGASGSPGEVFIASKKKTVDAVALLGAYDDSPEGKTLPAHDAAHEAIEAIVAEGHGRDACLIGSLANLLGKGGVKREAAAHWLRDSFGREPSPEDARAAGDKSARLIRARDEKDPKPLREILGDAPAALPLRAFAATALAAMPCPDALDDIVRAAEKLAADEKLLDTPAGARCARSFADALTALGRVPVPALEPKGPVAPNALAAVTDAVKIGRRKAAEECVDRALAAYAARDKDAEAWKKARADAAALGRPAQVRLLELADDKARAARAFSLLRAITGELIPDDVDAWKGYLGIK